MRTLPRGPQCTGKREDWPHCPLPTSSPLPPVFLSQSVAGIPPAGLAAE